MIYFCVYYNYGPKPSLSAGRVVPWNMTVRHKPSKLSDWALAESIFTYTTESGFDILKNRSITYPDIVQATVSKYLQLDISPENKFITPEDELIFLLKYSEDCEISLDI